MLQCLDLDKLPLGCLLDRILRPRESIIRNFFTDTLLEFGLIPSRSRTSPSGSGAWRLLHGAPMRPRAYSLVLDLHFTLHPATQIAHTDSPHDLSISWVGLHETEASSSCLSRPLMRNNFCCLGSVRARSGTLPRDSEM